MSRKIEQQMIAAIRAGANWKSGNTEVRYNDTTGDLDVLLHGNRIAEVYAAEGSVLPGTRFGKAGAQWTLAGWNTPTTRSRINALAAAFNWKRVYCKGGKPFAAGSGPDHEIDPAAWIAAI